MENTSARLLLVDDDEMSRRLVEMLLRPARHEIIVLKSGPEALDWLASNPCPDLLLSDVLMPEMDGFELCQEVRRRTPSATLPIILVTGLDRPEDVVRGLEAGADEFVTKSVSGPELRARVSTMLRIKKQQDSLREAMSLREDLIRLIVHDMRNPLAAIQIYQQVLLRQIPGQEVALAMGQAARQLGEMVDEMLVIARMEHGSLTLQPKLFVLGDIVRASREAPYLVDHQHRIDLEVDADEPVGLWDVRLLGRVLDNLLTNAIKYTPASGRIRLRLTYTGDQARIEVRDEGAGIPARYRKKVFEKFGIVPMKSEGVNQTGLGLYFCRLVAETHGGTIRAEANSPRGTAFILELPVKGTDENPAGRRSPHLAARNGKAARR